MNIILLLLLAFVASVTSLVHGNSKLTKHSGVVNRSEPSEVHVAAQYDPNRVASDLDMNNYIAKGNHRGCLLEATDRGAGMLSMDTRSPPSAQSLWQGTLESELALWNWREDSDYDQSDHCDFSDDSTIEHASMIGTALKALGLSDKPRSEGGDNMCYNIEHIDPDSMEDAEDQEYVVNGVTYYSTTASHAFAINQVGGAIFALNLVGVHVSAVNEWGRPVADNELPALRRPSDIMMAHWLRGNANPKNLKYYIAMNVVNFETIPVINRVLKDNGQTEIPSWPGLTVGLFHPHGQALLGTPIGVTVAYLLFQHKAQLGVKQITEITIFQDNGIYGTDVQLLFWIEDVDDPEDNEQKALRIRNEKLYSEPKDIIRTHTMHGDTGEVVSSDRLVKRVLVA